MKSELELTTEQLRFIGLEKQGLIEPVLCGACGRPILTERGLDEAAEWSEANNAIDCGEFSDPDCHWEEFCDYGVYSYSEDGNEIEIVDCGDCRR